jgi:hypothetical protein
MAALEATVAWYYAHAHQVEKDMRGIGIEQIQDYTDAARKKGIAWAVQ